MTRGAKQVPKKRTKQAADYGRGMDKAHCGICQHFTAPSSCSIVAGAVARTGWCKYFAHDPHTGTS